MTIWQPDLSKHTQARYQAIADEIETGIQEKTLKAGDKLPTHRALAEQLGVTIGTVTRAYAESEKRGLTTARVGSGTFISDPKDQPEKHFAIMSNGQRSQIDFTQNLSLPAQNSDILKNTLRSIANDVDHLDLLDYQAEQGASRQREWAANWLATKGAITNKENIIITCGGQHAITLALSSTTRPGENILCEGLTYPGLNAIATQLGIKVIGIDMDEQGLIPEKLEEQCQRGKYRAIYCTPLAQNPSNANMTQQRREAVMAVAERHHLWVIEDTILTAANHPKENSFHAINPERSLFICSHSKIQAGGLRVGYLVTPERLRQAAANSIRAHCWFTSPLTVEIAQRWADHPKMITAQAVAKQELAKRHQLARQYLADFDCRITDNSFHCWLKLPEPWRALDFQTRMQEREVGLYAAESFAVGNHPAPQAVRISLSAPETLDQVEQGLQIITDELTQGISSRLSVF